MKPGLLFMAKMETGTVILLVGGFIALIVVLAIIGKRATDKSIAQGKMLKRSSDFMEYAEIFTTRPLPFQELANQVKQIQVERLKKAMDAKQFFMQFLNADCERIAIENPTPMKIVGLPQYTQVIQPYEFGHPYSKRTCLWLKGLPLLKPTKILDHHEPYVNGGCKDAHGNLLRNSVKELHKQLTGGNANFL